MNMGVLQLETLGIIQDWIHVRPMFYSWNHIGNLISKFHDMKSVEHIV